MNHYFEHIMCETCRKKRFLKQAHWEWEQLFLGRRKIDLQRNWIGKNGHGKKKRWIDWIGIGEWYFGFDGNEQ